MPIIFTHSFLNDLQEEGDAHFPRRVLRKIFDPGGGFRPDNNDHRYTGIEDVLDSVCKSKEARDTGSYIYGVGRISFIPGGPHSVEDRLPAKPLLVTSATYGGYGGTGEADSGNPGTVGRGYRNSVASGDRLLGNSQVKLLVHALLGRRLIPHKEVFLVSPFLSPELLLRTARFGHVLDDLVEDGCKILLLTRPPKGLTDLEWFADLESRGIDVLFHPRLHAKIYLFCVDHARLRYGRAYSDLVVLGSANLTQAGIPFEGGDPNEELCYDLPNREMEAITGYVTFLATHSTDLTHARIEFARRKGRR